MTAVPPGRVAAVVRKHVLTRFREDSAIASTRVVIDVLGHFGIKARPLPCRVVAMNAEAVRLSDDGADPPGEWPASAWSVGIAGGPGEPLPGRWDGHLVAVTATHLIDASADQLSRPARNIVTTAGAWPLPDDWDRASTVIAHLDGGGIIGWKPGGADAARYRDSANWARADPGIMAVTEAAIRELEAPAPAPRTRWTAADVLEMHAGLRERHRHPDPALRRYYAAYARALATAPAIDDPEALLRFIYQPYYGTPGWEGLWCGMVARQLFTARTFQVTAPMTEMVAAAARQSQPLRVPPLPSPAGFAFLDAPLHVEEPMRGIAIRAVSWATETARLQGAAESCVRVLYWVHDANDSPETASARTAAWADEDMSELTMIWASLEPLTGPAVPPRAGDTTDMLCGVAHALWRFLGMELPGSPRGEVPRPVRRRVARSLSYQAVHVITLRKTRPLPEAPGGHRDVAWTCQWPVQEFWRHLDRYDVPRHAAMPDESRPGSPVYCAACGSRITRVRAHVRGPKDLPLRQARDLFRLAR